MADPPKVAILGAGSVGCFIGGCWQAASIPVSFIGRRAIEQDIARHGLTVSDFSGWQAHLDRVDFSGDLTPNPLLDGRSST